MKGRLAVKLGDPLAVYWFISTYKISIGIAFLISGANGDLFGRRIKILIGEASVIVGMILLASAKGTKYFQAGLGYLAFSAAFAGRRWFYPISSLNNLVS
jgi:hypothetical protein